MAIPNWLSLEKTSGTGNDTVRVTATTNDGEDRAATITVRTSSGLTKTVSIKQLGTVKASITIHCIESTGQVQTIYPDLAMTDTGGTRYPIWDSMIHVTLNAGGSSQRDTNSVPELPGKELTAFNLGIDWMDGDIFPEGTVFYINNWTFRVNGTTKIVNGTGSLRMYPAIKNGATNYVDFEFPDFIARAGDTLEMEIRMVIQMP